MKTKLDILEEHLEVLELANRTSRWSKLANWSSVFLGLKKSGKNFFGRKIVKNNTTCQLYNFWVKKGLKMAKKRPVYTTGKCPYLFI